MHRQIAKKSKPIKSEIDLCDQIEIQSGKFPIYSVLYQSPSANKPRFFKFLGKTTEIKYQFR